MNSTNRALNRGFALIIGLIVLVIGAAAAAAALIPSWFEGWKSIAADVGDSTTAFVESTPIGPDGPSWVVIALAAASVVLIIVLLVFIGKQGGGRTTTLVQSAPESREDGRIIIDTAVAERAIEQALERHDGIVSASATSYLVRKDPALSVTVNVRRGVSPGDIRAYVDDTIANWDAVFGRTVPVVIHLNSGLVSRVAKSTRVKAEFGG